MTKHTPLPDNMSLVNIGCGQLQWWKWESEEYVDGMRDGHFVGPAFTCGPYLSFIQTACNCHADLLEASKRARNLMADIVAEGAPKHVQTTFLMLSDAIRKVEENNDRGE